MAGGTNTTTATSSQQSGCGVTTGTQGSFNNHGEGSQNFNDAVINSGQNSGHNQASSSRSNSSGDESTRIILPNPCSGTHSSFNCYGKGSQDFSGAKISSGANSGNPRGGGPPTSGQQGRVTVTGTQDSFNNYGNQNFKGARINSGQNSGNS